MCSKGTPLRGLFQYPTLTAWGIKRRQRIINVKALANVTTKLLDPPTAGQLEMRLTFILKRSLVLYLMTLLTFKRSTEVA